MKTGRRAFVKRSITAPLVLTVGPALARANASSMACLSRDALRATQDKPIVMVSIEADEWMRVEVDLVGLSVWNGSSFQTLPGQYFLGVDKLTYWLLEQGATPNSQIGVPTQYKTFNATPRSLNQRRFALVYVDSQGRETGYAFEKNGGNAVTGSCWTSVAVRA